MKTLRGSFSALLTILCLGFSATAMAQEPTPTPEPTPECGQQVNDLIAAQNIDVGSIIITNTATDLVVTYSTTDPWFLKEIHLFAGTGPVPVGAAGNPKIGQFPYSVEFGAPLPNSYEIKIPLADLGVDCDDMVNVAAHAVVCKIVDGQVRRNETAWGFGEKRWTGSRWGWYTCYTICCDDFVCEEVFEDFQSLTQQPSLNLMIQDILFENNQFALKDNSVNVYLWDGCDITEKLLWMPAVPFGSVIAPTERYFLFKEDCILLKLTVAAHDTPGLMRVTTCDDEGNMLEQFEVNVTTECTEYMTNFTLPARKVKIFYEFGSELGIANITYCCPDHE